ncbi:hypothetical protein J6590_023756 [Homalodisca vitripennis]|nr:hypothetical protein J6590_023756 [Homalodisca vitripennis]
MLAILFLVAVASATPAPQTKILSVYEDPVQIQLKNQLPELQLHKSWCAGECYRHIVDRPVLVISQSGEGYDIHHSVSGLNGLAKNRENTRVLKVLNDDSKVAIIAPLSAFPDENFPGLMDAHLKMAEFNGKLGDLKEPSIMFLLTENQFKEFNKKKGYTKVADLGINQDTFFVAKEYSHFSRSLPIPVSPANPAAGYLYVDPLDQSIPLYTHQGLRILPNHLPVVQTRDAYGIANSQPIIGSPVVLKSAPITL